MSLNGLENNFSMSPSTIIYTGNQTGSGVQPKKLLRKHESLLFIFQVILNCTLVSSVLIICTLYKLQEVSSIYRLLLIISIFLVIGIYTLMGVFKQSPRFYNMAWRISLAWLCTMAVLIIFAFLTKTSELYSREVILLWFFAVAIIQIPLLKINYLAVSFYRKKYTKPISAVVVGLGKTARFFSAKLHDNHWLPDKVVGMINGYQEQVPDEISQQQRFPILGDVS